ncbi:MAG: EutN/CcmL family microcompartment protein [Phycisphaerae bacterium]
MFIGRVRGNVVTTQKVVQITGRKMLLVEPICVNAAGDDWTATGKTFVAVDAVGAGFDELVLVTQGSSARMTEGMGDAPVDAVVVGIIDSVHALSKRLYKKES